MSVVSWIFDHRWAITPSALEAIISVASRTNELSPDEIAKAIHGSMWEKYFEANGTPKEFQALESFNYPLLDGTRRVSLAKNVAIIPIVGPLFPRASLMSLSGGVSVQSLSYDFNLALESNQVESIILNFDSPGGEVTGINEFADMIYSARGRKSVISYVYGLGASAAYWLGSASKEVVISETGEAGSIGVVAAFSNNKRERDKKGIDDIEIVSSQSPNKRPDITTDKGKMIIQSMVDQMADIFISAVARNRGVDAKVVLENYGQGGMFIGKEAVSHGLADRVGTLESLITELQKPKSFHLLTGGRMNLAELKAQHPDVYEQAVAIGRQDMESKISAAREEGAVAENTRIQEIESLTVPGAESVIASNKFTREMTKDKVATCILETQKAEAKRIADASGVDAEKLRKAASGMGAGASSSVSEDAQEQAVIASMAVGLNSKK